MKNIKCIYNQYCELTKSCTKCDLINHRDINNRIIRQLQLDAMNRKDSDLKIKSTK